MSWMKSGLRIKMRQQTLQLASLLSRWCQVREDLIFAFEKSLETGLEDPMRQAVSDLLVRVRGGMSHDQALDLMQSSIDHEHFQDLITAIRFNFRHRGDLPALLEQLEIQLNRIEEEFERRRLSNSRDSGLTIAILLAVPALFAIRLLTSEELRLMFFDSLIGQFLLLVGLLSYLAAFAGLLITRRRITG